MDKIYFVVEMLRYNDREKHSYVIGVWDDEILALKEAWSHMEYRAGKYGGEVTGYNLNGGKQVYFRELDCWDAFAASCQKTAAEIRKLIDADKFEPVAAEPEKKQEEPVKAPPETPSTRGKRAKKSKLPS